jgi:hypothetical protein
MYCPAAHEVQATPPLAPEKLPAGHGEHALASLAPAMLPAGQGAHGTLDRGLNVPAVQEVHPREYPPALYHPLMQVEHAPGEMEAVPVHPNRKSPAAHVAQGLHCPGLVPLQSLA